MSATNGEDDTEDKSWADTMASVERFLRGQSADEQLRKAMAAAIRVKFSSNEAMDRVFMVDTTPGIFIQWLMTKAWKSWRVPTDNGQYLVILSYFPTPEWIDAVKLGDVILDVSHEPPIESHPPGIIAFTITARSTERIEVTATCSVPEVSHIFEELLQLIGRSFPESGLDDSPAKRGGRQKSTGPTGEQLRLIKTIGELRSKGHSHAQIANRVKLSRSRISQICREKGFEKGVKGN